jgi:Domain of unknown function (DUF6532)
VRTENVPVVTPPRKGERYPQDSSRPSAQGSRGRFLLSGMSPMSQDNVREMKGLFRIYILSENAFPDHHTAEMWIRNRCREEHNWIPNDAQLRKVKTSFVSYHLEELLLTLLVKIRDHQLNVRSLIISENRKLILECYDLPSEVGLKIARVDTLLSDWNWIHEEISQVGFISIVSFLPN